MTQPWQGSESQAVQCRLLIWRHSSVNRDRNEDFIAKAFFEDGLILRRDLSNHAEICSDCLGPSRALVISRLETQSGGSAGWKPVRLSLCSRK